MKEETKLREEMKILLSKISSLPHKSDARLILTDVMHYTASLLGIELKDRGDG